MIVEIGAGLNVRFARYSRVVAVMANLGWAAAVVLVIGSPSYAAENLIDRFAKLSCAVVHLAAGNSSGTGFFIDSQGDILTASHVVIDRAFAPQGDSFHPVLSPKGTITATQADGHVRGVTSLSPTERDSANALKDLMILHTGEPSPCFLRLGNSASLQIGQHLIAIGFPGTTPSGVLYEGFLSTRPMVMHDLGPILGYGGQSYKISYDVLRVQMPITEGASGSPLIDDNNEVVGVVSEIPIVALKDIQDIIAAYVESGRGSGVLLGGFDTNRVLSELAYVVTGFETPGSGYAVPISDLKQ